MKNINDFQSYLKSFSLAELSKLREEYENLLVNMVCSEDIVLKLALIDQEMSIKENR